MVALALHFDLRNPSFAGTTSSERIRAAVEMAAWADTLGGKVVSISEHHGADDGYLPSPLVLAGAIAAVTTNVRIAMTALLAPFYEPLRLAEDLAVLDALSEGRIDVTLGAGYVLREFEMFGIASGERGRRMEHVVRTLRQAWTGEPFEHEGRTVRVTPAPHRPGGPPIVLGGSSDAAARRAARIADGFLPSNAGCWDAYRDERQRQGGHDPGPLTAAPTSSMTVLADDVDAAWDELEPYFLHHVNAYAAWLADAGLAGPYRATTAGELRAGGSFRVVTPAAYATELRAAGERAVASFHPMVGGIPPTMAWRSLRLFEEQVLPAL